MVKNIITTIIVAVVSVVIGMAIGGNPVGNEYPMTTVVCDIDEENDIVTCMDFNGFTWQFEGVEEWQVGWIASFIMDDMGTADIHDDVILDVKYDGWLNSTAWGWDGTYPVLLINND